MSCLPFAAWAAKKAAQIVGESGGGSSGGFPVVVLGCETDGETQDQYAFTAEESAIMTGAASDSDIVCVIISSATFPMPVLLRKTVSEDGVIFTCIFAHLRLLAFQLSESEWAMMIGV